KRKGTLQNAERLCSKLLVILYHRLPYPTRGYLSVSVLTRAFACSVLSRLFSIREIASAIVSMSSGCIPLDVTAGVPRRTPLVTKGDWGSLGMVFLLQVIFTSSRRFSISLPVTPRFFRSTSIR